MRASALRRSVVTAAASCGLLLTGAAAPALAQGDPGRANQASSQQQAQQSTDQPTEAELRSIVLDVVRTHVQATGQTQATVNITDHVATVDVTVIVNNDVRDEHGLEVELRNAIDEAISARFPGLEVQVNVGVDDDEGGNQAGDGNGELTEAELRSLVIDVVARKVEATGQTRVVVEQLTDSVVTVFAIVTINNDVEDEHGLETELHAAIDGAIRARVDGHTAVEVAVDVRDDDNGNRPDRVSGGHDAAAGTGRDRPGDRDQITRVPEGSVAAGGQPGSDLVEYALGGSALAAALGAGAAATRRFRRANR